MHQPIYVPYLDPFGADPYFSFSIPDIHNQRFGPYTTWPRDAINAGSGLAHLGAQVSFSGSLIENLNALEAAGINGGMWNNWDGAYRAAQSNLTALGNHRLEMVAFGYHHPLMPLNGERDVRMQLRLHKLIHGMTWNTSFSEGLYPPETAFSERMIPALAAEGIQWVLVDNIHFDRACVGYPHTTDSGLFAPNRADQLNPDPAANGGRWVQLQNLWAPSRVSVPFGYQPHYAEHVDPETGAITRVVAVPAARYEGNEDGRGGYGAFLYDQVMDTYLPDNDDPAHPMFVMLHHDGDNYGGGSDSYYHYNFQNMVNWVQTDPDYEVTTVNDYLDRFPVATNDAIHVEDGSWAGADNGDPEFKKWLGGDVSAGATSPDINSWAVLVAARNRIATLEQLDAVDIDSTTEMTHVLNGTGDPIHRAWYYLLCAQASDYWYWDGTEVWDSNVTRGCNLALSQADPALASASFVDQTPPTLFVPQREPYNPGGYEWNSTPESSDFEVWTLAYDYSGLTGMTLKWRVDADGVNPLSSVQNETYAGGSEVGAWQSVPMSPASVPTPAGVLAASAKATRYGGMITGQHDVLIDYYVEATDSLGNVEKSDIMHVWVGTSDNGGGGDAVTITPDPAIAGQSVTVDYDASGGPLAGAPSVLMHYGFNNWNPVISPDAAMSDTDGDGVWTVTVPVQGSATQLDLVFNDGNNNWDNNNGNDWHFAVDGGDPNAGFEMDGSLDGEAQLVASNGGIDLWAALDGSTLYLATEPAGGGNDRFIVLAQTPGSMGPAMWAKSGSVAAWDAFVGNEADNGWAGWFDAAGATQLASGSVLECTIDLAGELGSLPDSVHAAVLSYATPDGGALVPSVQAPASLDGDGDADSNEFSLIRLCDLRGDCCPADLNGDGLLDLMDINTFVLGFSIQDPVADLAPPFGTFDLADINAFITAFVAGCP
ncbi:MAG: hypothetical protein H6810_12820 [Phycisphaeraceae bacterium]|nr:MAG: hypothetical protein H6810_12820 [Phycisphaeraceae bacterium]